MVLFLEDSCPSFYKGLLTLTKLSGETVGVSGSFKVTGRFVGRSREIQSFGINVKDVLKYPN